MSESIYNLAPLEYTSPTKAPRHVSKHDPTLSPSGSTFGCKGTTRLFGAGAVVKKDGAMFGPPSPSSGLPRIHSNTTLSPSRSSGGFGSSGGGTGSFTYTDKTKPPLPSQSEKPIMGITTTKNFVTSNAVEAILQVPKKTNIGDLDYVKKDDFGKVPAYLEKVKEEVRRENEMIERYVRTQLGGGSSDGPEYQTEYEEMDEYERQDLLGALKTKWGEVQAKYQRTTHLVSLDTTGQVRRKEAMEKELQQIEKDIARLESSEAILIRK